ncbi:MAG: glutamine--fructose-6-phosphate transaminase (isomerizing) [Chloroflexi bacterium]|nr:glutamine--fructose-6-phosphate transaminase (isomerizing) [Chloroflexota bacterium]
MCGIVGYVGPRQAGPIILRGLQSLEYRGYDSAGIAVLDGPGELAIRKSVGKVRELTSFLSNGAPSGTTGLGHTRWATHGKVALTNAHPHMDCRGELAVVHNGIVENYLELKKSLLERGHTFASETDSEVIPHLIEEGLAQGKSFEDAFAPLVDRLHGAHAIVALWKKAPGKLLAMRRGNAGGLIVGLGQSEALVASDLPALVPLARRVCFLEDREIAVLTPAEVKVITPLGRVVPKRFDPVSTDAAWADKGGYKHFMLKEIMEQPQTVGSALRGRVDFEAGEVRLEGFPLSREQVLDLRRVLLIGCGTSLHAAMVGRRLIETFAGVPAEAESSSEFRYRNPTIDAHTLVVAIAQSGETADTLAAMDEVRQKGGRLVAICNAEGSQATRLAEATFSMRAGPEIGVASTKTFLASLTILALLGLQLGQGREALGRQLLQESLGHLASAPYLLGQVIADLGPYQRMARRFCHYEHFLYLGRGIHHPIALEGALKLKEISYIHAEGYPAGEMKHGPIALIDDKMPVVAIAPRDELYPKMLNNIEEVKARGGTVIAVGTQGDQELAAKTDHLLIVPASPPIIAPLLVTPALQLLAYYIGVQKGCDVDQPRNLAKSVTVE